MLLAWRTIGNIQLSEQWQLTNISTGNLYRITHTIDGKPSGTLRAAIGQEVESIIFDRRLIGYRSGVLEGQLFNIPDGIPSRRIAIQRLDSLPVNWTVKIEELIDLATELPLSIDDIEDLRIELNAKAAASDVAALSATTATALSGKSPAIHQHEIADINGLAIALDEKVESTDLAASEQLILAQVAQKSSIGHSHAIADTTGLQASLDAKADKTELPKLSTTPPSNPTAGTIWSELLSSNRVETWIYINSKWQTLSTYRFDFPSKDSFGNGFYSLFLPLDHRYDYLFIELSTYCDYNGSSPINGTTDFFNVVIWVTSDATVNVVADTGALPNSELKKVVTINTIFSPTDKEFLEHRVLKTGSAPGVRIASFLTYRLIRK
ncbi:hypothetical protein [Brunnivagina elsteri]|uniref:Uncharacterized protein n=1 Tax=Brunnivagina elsteri CCALA 953 TaxID=987040 RepID=A0A2A2TLK4_9CYAN|nr:hypothetical protein [Calothrix elsteri]PAX58365.1 hypothetical protein CK510_07800 [Calothrix elsteri CCALA 953]